MARWLTGCLLLALCACSPTAVRTLTERAAVLREAGEDGDEGTIDTTYGVFDPLFGAQLPWEEGAPEARYHRAPGEPSRADYLVQFVGPIGAAARATVAATGARTVGFFPHNALVVAATEGQAETLARGYAVRAVVPVPPVLRVHPTLFAMLPGSHGGHDDGPAHLNVQGQADVLVEVDEPASLALVAEALARGGSRVVPEPRATFVEQEADVAAEVPCADASDDERGPREVSPGAGDGGHTGDIDPSLRLGHPAGPGGSPMPSFVGRGDDGDGITPVPPRLPAPGASARRTHSDPGVAGGAAASAADRATRADAEEADETRALHVRLDAAGLAQLARMAEVVAIAPYPQWRLLNARSSGLLQAGQPNERRLQASGLDGRGQVVAVADTGLHVKSCYFGAAGKIVDYQSFVADRVERGDVNGHGTHVAGSIAGEDKKGRFCGMAPKAGLVVQQCAGKNDTAGLGSNVAALLARAYRAGARVHANSWGIEGGGYTPVVRAVDRFVAEHPDMVVVAAVGNSSYPAEPAPNTAMGPATAKNVVAVGAYEGARPNRLAPFSLEGPTDDGRIKPLVLAPGVAVTSARHGKRCDTQVLSGTSMAAPLVAGGLALVRQYFVQGRYPDNVPDAAAAWQPSAALIKAVLLVGAEPIDIGYGRLPVPDAFQQGFGRARLDRSLGLDGGGRELYVSDGEVALDTGERWEACFDVAAASAVDVALSWTDPPPKREGAAVTLTHNLDLQLVDATGRFARGNEGLHGNVVDPLPDELNVEEVVRRRHLPGGRTCVRVSARLAPERPQRFAVAVLAARRGEVTARRLPP